MKKTCPVSNTSFTATESDQKVYEKLGISVPTLCPEERNRRRCAHRNDRTFYKRKCDASGKTIVSMYPPETPWPVYHQSEWYKDTWNPLDYGQAYDFEKPFFEQFKELQSKVPRLGMDLVNCENSNFCNYCGDCKDCYLDIAAERNEKCMYGLFNKFCEYCYDCTFTYNSQWSYACLNSYNAYECTFSQYLENCSNCDFSFDLKGCSDCVFCWNLRRKQYCIFNKQYTKEKYVEALKHFQKGSYTEQQKYVQRWRKHVSEDVIHRAVWALNCEDCTGNNIKNSKNCQHAFNVSDSWDSSYLYDVLDAKDCRDLNYSLYKPELAVECMSTLNMVMSAFCTASHYCSDSFYVDLCNNSQHLFGCIGVNRGKFCILNKQHNEAEYHDLKAKIIEHMKQTGEWGEFFSASLSPFAYNETVAQEYFPSTKEEAEAHGCRWRGEDQKEYETQTVAIPNNISDVSDDICDAVLACEVTGKNFKIQKAELQFYRKMGLPIPRKHPEQRHLERMKLRNPRELYKRKCAVSGKKILTTYAPDRPEKVLCEEEYLKVVG